MSDYCCNKNGITLLYACSGAANVGFLADQVARNIMKDGLGKMTCLAGVGGKLSGFTESAKAATRNVVIDGCPVSCGKKILDDLGLPHTQFVLTQYGVEKGTTEITGDLINTVTARIARELAHD